MVKTKISKKKAHPPTDSDSDDSYRGALKRMFKLGHKAPRRVLPRGMSEAVAQKIHQSVAEVLLEGNLALL